MNLNKNEKIAVVVGIVVIIIFFAAGSIYQYLSGNSNQTKNMTQSDSKTTVVQDAVVGTGVVAENGKKITVNYTGYLSDGTKFDSSLDRGVPFEFTLGVGQVIKGWEVGIQGMKVGGKRTIIVPPEFGYGDREIGSIPANSTLIFDVELLKVQ